MFNCNIRYNDTNINISVEMQYDKLQSILENICENEGIDKLNIVVNKLVQSDDTKLTYIVPVIEYAQDSSSDAIVKLIDTADGITDMTMYTAASSVLKKAAAVWTKEIRYVWTKEKGSGAYI